MSIDCKLAPSVTCWIGSSDALFKLKSEIGKLTNSTLPIHISGEPGTGKLLAVKQIHAQSTHKQGELVVSCCKQWGPKGALEKLNQLIAQASNGTVYLKNIDVLSAQQFELIQSYWLYDAPLTKPVRLITSTTHTQTVHSMSGTRPLNWLHYYCLTLTLPSLAERKDDIVPLIKHIQRTGEGLNKLELTESAISILSEYPWPGNVEQLRRCLEKLLVLNDRQVITPQRLLEAFPGMHRQSAVSETVDAVSDDSGGCSPMVSFEEKLALYAQSTPMHEHTPDMIRLHDNAHPALQRALTYLDKHYTQPLSLSEVANCACVSPSHLSFLFKRYVGLSFKQTLLRIRIKSAMALFRENPYSQVTEGCDDVGFSDLSFFVRKFKAVVGVSPGVYRDQRTKH